MPKGAPRKKVTSGERFSIRKQERIEELEESVAFFSATNKSVRERDTVGDLLRNLGTKFRAAEIQSVPSREEFPDVRFRSASFEIKEIVDQGRRRHDEYKRELANVRRAKTYRELLEVSDFPRCDISVAELLEEVAVVSDGLRKKYPAATLRTLDLLVYRNRLGVWGLMEKPFPTTADVRLDGWRSVSVVMGHRAIVFLARKSAPRFLKLAVGTIRHRPRPRGKAGAN